MKVITDIYIFKTPNDIKTYKALWDTGASETLISSKVITELNLEETGSVEVSTINGIINTKRFNCAILLKNHSKSINIQPAEFIYRTEFDVIIGMDIIEYGLFILNKGNFSFIIEQLQ